MTSQYNPTAWFWYVGGDTTKVFSSQVGDYVLPTALSFTSWQANGNNPSRIDTEANLGAVLAAAGSVKPLNVNVQNGWLQAQVDRLDFVLLQIAFNHENRIRVLEGKAAVTVAQFKTAIKALL